MDPLTHTLVGASLAATGLKRKTVLGTATLLIAANLPDIDGVCQLMGTDAGLGGRRGHTHGVLALLLLPVLLAAVMFVIAQWWERRQQKRKADLEEVDTPAPAGPAVSFRWLWLLSAIGVASHPLLDWMNSYGVRTLMPFSARWFYGDALFIIDPVVWLLAGAAVVLAWGRSKLAAVGWMLLALATTAVVVVPQVTPPSAKLLWCVGAGLVGYLRVRDKPPNPKPTALICLSLLVLYIGTMLLGTHNAHRKTIQWLQRNGMQAQMVVATPLPARPLAREVIVKMENAYHYFEVSAFADASPRPTRAPLPEGEKTPAVLAALAAPGVQGFVHWMRLPAFEQRKTATGYEVTLLDARYAHSSGARLGRTKVDLDHNLRVISPGS